MTETAIETAERPRKPNRCAARCGGNAAPHDIYCQECREQITAEAWLLIECEEVR